MKKTSFWNNSENNSEYTPKRTTSIPRRRVNIASRNENNPLQSRGGFRASKSEKKFSMNNGNFLEKIKNFFLSGAFLRRLIGGLLILGIIGFVLVWGIFLKDLPDIRNVENPDFTKESTVFYDNDGNEFYRYGENGKRIYVKYEQISQSIKDALVAAEDQGFFENPGIDVFGLARAGFNYATGRANQVQGTSTLSQQLIKNTLLTNERSLKRKIQEAYLAYKLNQTYSKEQILEMYLNVIEFGHGANGVEQASLTFFGKSAKDVGPLGATILASLPKSPTAFSPYSKRERLMGKIEAYPSDNNKDRIILKLDIANGEYAPLYKIFKEYIKWLSFKPKGNNSVEICGLKKEFTNNIAYEPNSNGCKTVNYDDLLNVLGNITVKWNLAINGNPAENYTIEYTVWRKDYVATQMLKYEKITPEIFSGIIYDGLEFQFNQPKTSLKYPYFVMYVQEQLEQKYGDDINIKSGLRVYTTLRPHLQQQAENIIQEQVNNNIKAGLGATSASLVAMDNTTGEIIAMVGGPNYDKDKNNMTTALRQPGSSFKPIVYALAISKWPIGPESPIADVKTKFGRYEPNNYDEGFKGIMSVAKALAYSRNITAVKMYFLAGNEKEIIPFAKKLGINSLNENFGYGAALSLGSGEVKATEMMQAYSVFANNGIKREAFAIKRIEDHQWGIIEEKTSNQWQQVFSPEASHIINVILSENDYRPDSKTWRDNLTVRGKTAAAKTGTSNMENKKTGKILPRDTWTVGYSPNITTVVWAGNVDGAPLGGKCDGINCAAPAWNKFMTYALKDLPNTPFKAPEWLLTYKTARLSGLLSDSGITNIMAVKLDEKDSGNREVKIDYCGGGAVTSETPEESIVVSYTTASKPIIDRFEQDWLKAFYNAANVSAGSNANYDPNCDRKNSGMWSVNISAKIVWAGQNIVEATWSGDRPIAKFRAITNGKVLKETKYDDRANSGSDRASISDVPAGTTVTIELIDVYGNKYTRSISAGTETTAETPTLTPPSLPSLIEDTSNIEPTITITNPSRSSINIYKGEMFNLRFWTNLPPATGSVTISVDGVALKNATGQSEFVIPIVTSEMSLGNHSVTVTASNKGKTTSKAFTLTVLEK